MTLLHTDIEPKNDVYITVGFTTKIPMTLLHIHSLECVPWSLSTMPYEAINHNRDFCQSIQLMQGVYSCRRTGMSMSPSIALHWSLVTFRIVIMLPEVLDKKPSKKNWIWSFALVQGDKATVKSLIDSSTGYHHKVSDQDLHRLLSGRGDVGGVEGCASVVKGIDIYEFHPWELVSSKLSLLSIFDSLNDRDICSHVCTNHHIWLYLAKLLARITLILDSKHADARRYIRTQSIATVQRKINYKLRGELTFLLLKLKPDLHRMPRLFWLKLVDWVWPTSASEAVCHLPSFL